MLLSTYVYHQPSTNYQCFSVLEIMLCRVARLRNNCASLIRNRISYKSEHRMMSSISIKGNVCLSVCLSVTMHFHNFNAIAFKPSQGDAEFPNSGRWGSRDSRPRLLRIKRLTPPCHPKSWFSSNAPRVSPGLLPRETGIGHGTGYCPGFRGLAREPGIAQGTGEGGRLPDSHPPGAT